VRGKEGEEGDSGERRGLCSLSRACRRSFPPSRENQIKGRGGERVGEGGRMGPETFTVERAASGRAGEDYLKGRKRAREGGS